MDYRRNTRETAKFLVSPQIRRPLTLAAGRVLARARVIVAKHSGDTARSGRLVHRTRGGRKNDRAVVSVVFGEEAVAEQFGNKRRRAKRFLTRAVS